jgi:ribosome-associated toxin RatA of RatAB toxin-antitoxin module
LCSKGNAMHEIRNSETVPYTAREMFDLLADVDRYKEFLPWCRDSRIVTREKDNVVVAELQVGFGPLNATFASRNTHRTDRAIDMELVNGPFELLEGSWHLEPVAGDGCCMSLELRFKFSHPHLEAPFNYMFKEAMETLVRAFKERAAELYGPSDPGDQ